VYEPDILCIAVLRAWAPSSQAAPHGHVNEAG